MSAQQVLFDAPGPRARRTILIGNIVGVLVALGVLAWVVSALADRGQLAGSMWSPFLEGRTWEFFILPGLLNTLKAAGASIVGAVLFGLVFGVGRLSHAAPIRWVAGTVVEFFRAVPVLLMMIFFWLALGRSGVVQPQDAPFLAVVIALTLYNGSVIAELVRSGVHGLPKGQREAGMAIGLTRTQSLRNVEVPQALLAMLPALVSQFVVILKDSALGFIITYPELLQGVRRLGVGEGNVIPSLLVAAAIFIAINFALSSLATRLSGFLSFRTRGRRPAARGSMTMDPAST
ncbi:amino acid ABC transporter permease [Arthrobacter sp. RIT-PI-e]|uniref:amino acid ABC transporter permease n=1 Tax=Arthrobacter sp. RIT-PI-e TaxID=1681197 RepID=UPI000676A088|nr:amino acid ABC transporter permease [Arthrobacter sp. RIT-PI-e]KNC20047.1 amino acid ABC transporter permease [Arthrobacter sp. RIT-PI-e]